MPESSPFSPAVALAKEGAVFYGSAKAEQTNIPKKESKIVTGVKKAVDAWLERVGPKSVEKHFIKAHENVLATLNNDQRKEVFAKEADAWQKAGKRWGIAAAAIDVGLAGLGGYFAIRGWTNLPGAADVYTRGANWITKNTPNIPVINRLPGLLALPYDEAARSHASAPDFKVQIDALSFSEKRAQQVGSVISGLPTLGSLGILLGSGPGHWLAHLAVSGNEAFYKAKARTHNYVDSGKAAEHAAKLGNAVGKAATETAKYVAEHPDEIRKTVETVNRVKRQNAESAQKLAEAQKKAADIALEKEYQDWVSHHPDKAYYEQSGQPYPSKAEYVAKKNEEEAKRKANKEVEERGVAKH